MAGVAAYCLHDRREPGKAQPKSAERVEWTDTRNLPTSRGDRAARSDGGHRGGGPRTSNAWREGRQWGGSWRSRYCQYSLNWAPDEAPDRQEMSRAVDESLKALGLEKHQALIVAPVHFAAGARQTAAPWAGARARRRVRAMTKPYGSSLSPALWAINEEAGPSRAELEDLEPDPKS